MNTYINKGTYYSSQNDVCKSKTINFLEYQYIAVVQNKNLLKSCHLRMIRDDEYSLQTDSFIKHYQKSSDLVGVVNTLLVC